MQKRDSCIWDISNVKERYYLKLLLSESSYFFSSWLRHYLTSRKVVSTILIEANGFFNEPTPSSHTKTLGLTQPLTEMSTRNLPGGKVQPAHKAHNLTIICEPIVYKMFEPRSLTTLRASMACYRDSFIFYLYWSLQYILDYFRILFMLGRVSTKLLQDAKPFNPS
jgi:hypothetical protein